MSKLIRMTNYQISFSELGNILNHELLFQKFKTEQFGKIRFFGFIIF